MLKRLCQIGMLAAVLCTVTTLGFAGEQVATALGPKRVGVVVFADQPMFNQKAFTTIVKKIEVELAAHYDVNLEFVPLSFDRTTFLEKFSEEYEAYITTVMKQYQVDYILFGELLKSEGRLVIYSFSIKGEQYPTYLPFSNSLKEKFTQIAPGFYLNAVNVFSSDISQKRLY